MHSKFSPYCHDLTFSILRSFFYLIVKGVRFATKVEAQKIRSRYNFKTFSPSYATSQKKSPKNHEHKPLRVGPINS